MFKAFLVKYAEIGIKGKNRYLFEDALIRQMEYVLKPVEGTFHVTKEQGRIYVLTEGDFDYEERFINSSLVLLFIFFEISKPHCGHPSFEFTWCVGT